METSQFNEDGISTITFLWSLKTVFHVFHVSETEYPVGKNVGRGFVLSVGIWLDHEMFNNDIISVACEGFCSEPVTQSIQL